MKRINILLLGVLAVAVALFGVYRFWFHDMIDRTGPVITVDEELLEISVKDPEEVLLQGIQAIDKRDGDVTASLLVESIYGITKDNLTTVTYAAFDHSGNVSKIERQVRYKDYRSPRFSLSRSLCVPSGSNFDLLSHVGANDVLDGDINRRVRATLVSDTKSINQVGSHTVRFQVTNDLGDTVVVEMPVEVYDPQWYSAQVELEEYLIYLNKGDVFVPERYLENFVVRGADINVSNGIPANVQCSITDTVDTHTPGVYSVTYTLSQTQNMTTFAGQSVLIVIVEE